ncbi:MAG: hypothetical protein H7138_26675 [Myxococcales bacterium]|nr:hypothetical protein [Myxococcales bacterium]
MIQSDQPETVTVVATPPAGTTGATDNNFIDRVVEVLASRGSATNRIVQASCVRDMDVALSKIITRRFKGTLRLQIVGHSISGMLSLGASWMPEHQVATQAFVYPYYVLDTNPAALGLLAKYAGKISEVLLVGCNIGSASSFGYAINGRTLTYTLAELLRCLVKGADDVVSPDEFDARGWYTPALHHRRPKGWRWVEAMPPVWTDPGLDPVTSRVKRAQTFRIRAITSSLLRGHANAEPVVFDADSEIVLTCQRVAPDKPTSALPELSIETDHGPAQLLCGGQYLRWMDTYYVVDQTPQLANALTATLWSTTAA